MIDHICYFIGGVFLANAVPHITSGMTGRAFQTPFAKPPGKGLSSATVNVIWGFVNLIIAYLLITQAGHFDIHALADVLATGIGALLMALYAAHHFGPFHGGDLQ